MTIKGGYLQVKPDWFKPENYTGFDRVSGEPYQNLQDLWSKSLQLRRILLNPANHLPENLKNECIEKLIQNPLDDCGFGKMNYISHKELLWDQHSPSDKTHPYGQPTVSPTRYGQISESITNTTNIAPGTCLDDLYFQDSLNPHPSAFLTINLAASDSLIKRDFNNWLSVEDFISLDPKYVSWNRSLKADLGKLKTFKYNESAPRTSLYRPYSKQWVYFDKNLNAYLNQLPRILPDEEKDNRVIYINGAGNGGKDFSALITNVTPDLNLQHSGGQGFPLKLYEKTSLAGVLTDIDDLQNDMFASTPTMELEKCDAEYTVKDGITNEGLAHFQTAYPAETITKEDVFYYIYGLLHSEDYKKRYADNLSKELPRIPCVKKASDFWAFSKAGRDLAELHINYETVQPYPVSFAGGALFMNDFTDKDYRVEQMKFGKTGKATDKTTVIYNHKITMTNIPLEAYDYVVNGKPALEWVMERQAVTTHKDSGIVNDANLWATETMHDAAYPLKLFQRVITVSLETMKIVKALPRLDIAQAEDK